VASPFVVFEGERSLIDWGIRGARHENNHDRYLAAVGDLFVLYQPATLVLQNMDPPDTRRANRIRRLNDEIVGALRMGLVFRCIRILAARFGTLLGN